MSHVNVLFFGSYGDLVLTVRPFVDIVRRGLFTVAVVTVVPEVSRIPALLSSRSRDDWWVDDTGAAAPLIENA